MKKISERQTKAGNQECYEKLETHSLTLSHSLTLDMLNNFCFHVYAQKSLSHSHTFSLFQSLTYSLSTCATAVSTGPLRRRGEGPEVYREAKVG